MNQKIIFDDEGPTSLKLYTAVLTQFEPGSGNLQCRQAVVLAEDERMASVILAARWPDWDLQSLDCLTDAEWLKWVVLDGNCPQALLLRQFRIGNLVAVPADD